MKKIFLLLFSFLFSTLSCEIQKKEQIVYFKEYWFRDFRILKHENFEQNIYSINDTIEFFQNEILIFKLYKSIGVNLYNNDRLVKLKDTTVYFQEKPYKISIWGDNLEITDGGTLYYFSEELGLIISHSDTWPNIKLLRNLNKKKDIELKCIQKQLVPSFFLRDTLIKELNNFFE